MGDEPAQAWPGLCEEECLVWGKSPHHKGGRDGAYGGPIDVSYIIIV